MLFLQEYFPNITVLLLLLCNNEVLWLKVSKINSPKYLKHIHREWEIQLVYLSQISFFALSFSYFL